MKHCEDFLELISAYVDGELSETEVAELEAHLETCEDCRRTLEFYRELSALEQESLVEPPAGLHDSIMSAVKRDKRRSFVRTLPALVGTLAACLVILIGVSFFNGFGGGEESAGAGADDMMSARMTDGTGTEIERANEAAPAAAAGMRIATTGAAESSTAESGTVTYGASASQDASAEDSGEAVSYKNADTAAYDPTEAVESPSAIEGLSLDPEVDTGNTTNDFTSSDETAPEEQGDGTAETTPEESDISAETTSLPAMFRLPNISVADAIVDNKIVIDADAVTDFSYDNRMYELGEDADLADMREKLDRFASLELTPLDEAPDVEGLESVGVTVWYSDTILVFVCYPDDGYVVEDDRWYAFE